MPAPHEHALAVFENHGRGHVAVAAERYHVERQVRVGGVGFLVRAGSLQRLDRVAFFHGGFKIQIGARLFHFTLPFVDQVVALAFKHQARAFYIFGVFLLRNEPGTRSAAATDVVVEARTYGVFGRQFHGAFANLEQPCRNVDELVDIARTHVRTVILAAVLLDGTRQRKSREGLLD